MFIVVILNDFERIEMIKCLTIALALVEDSYPTKSGLCSFEYQELEQQPVIMYGDAPLFIVIGLLQLVATYPGTTISHLLPCLSVASIFRVCSCYPDVCVWMTF